MTLPGFDGLFDLVHHTWNPPSLDYRTHLLAKYRQSGFCHLYIKKQKQKPAVRTDVCCLSSKKVGLFSFSPEV